MNGSVGQDVPQDLRGDLAKAHRLVVWTLAYLISCVALLAAVLGGSQALKTAWFDDALSLIPPSLFLIGSRLSPKSANREFPFGFNRAVSAGYLGASVALLGIGIWLLIDSLVKLVSSEHPSIGGAVLFGHVIWHGWLAIPVLLWSSVPAFFLGRAKKQLAERLHDKVLLSDSRMNEADWQTGLAAVLGICGVALGFWWADALAGAVISLDIVRDGFLDVKGAISDLMDRRPQKLLGDGADPLPENVLAYLKRQDWIAEAAVRLREDGRLFVGEAFIVPKEDNDLTRRISAATKDCCKLDWRLSEFTIAPVPEIPEMMRRVEQAKHEVEPRGGAAHDQHG